MDGIVKYIQIDSHLPDGTPAIELLHPGVFEKTASAKNAHPLIKQAVASLPERDDGIWVLLNALGAGEFWGGNTNGDYFPEEPLKYACDMSQTCTREQDYGFKTFEKYAFPYRHHVNKDPHKSVGELVKIAVWNDQMKRVELIHFLRRNSEFDDFGEILKVGAPDLVTRVEEGLSTPVSMGCKVPFDICSICGNQAKNVDLYCDHLKYAMNQVMSDGRKVNAINTRPRFFDISYVNKGAEKTAQVLMKLAGHKEEARNSGNRTLFLISEGVTKAASEGREYSVPSAFYAELVKSAQDKKADKEGAISKEVPSNVEPSPAERVNKDVGVPLLKAVEPSFPDAVLKVLARHPLGEATSTLSSLGMALKPQEMHKIIIIKIQAGVKPDQIGKPEISTDLVRPSLASLLRAQIEKRSSFREPMRRRVLNLLNESPEQILDKIAANDEAAREVLDVTEPSFMGKAAPLAALAAALFALYRKNVKGAKLPQFIESAFKKYPELPAAVVGAGIGGVFGLAGQSLIQHFGGAPQEKIAGRFAREAGLAGLAFAAPYLYSGYVQSKALRGEPISKKEVALARHPGTLAVAGTAGVLGRRAIAAKARQLWKGRAQKPKGWFREVLEKGASTSLPVEDILRYGTHPKVVDLAITKGLCKVAYRVEMWESSEN